VTAPLVTIGVPVYRGRDTLPGLLECLRTQTYENLDILLSIDANDQPSAEAAAPILAKDPRIRIVVQPVRLGWAGNTDWTMKNCRGDFYIYQQHDDRVSPTYVADLVAAAARWPDSSLCFSTLRYTGDRSWDVPVPPLLGDSVARVRSYLRRLDWVPFRGLVRTTALDRTAGLLLSDFDPFDSLGTEIRFMAELARLGTFRFVAGPIYFKRWDGNNLSAKRDGWSPAHRLRATACWMAWMVEAVVPAGRTLDERRNLFAETVERFIGRNDGFRWAARILRHELGAGTPLRMIHTQLRRRPPPPGLGPLGAAERAELLHLGMDYLVAGRRFDPVASLGRSWQELETGLKRRYG